MSRVLQLGKCCLRTASKSEYKVNGELPIIIWQNLPLQNDLAPLISRQFKCNRTSSDKIVFMKVYDGCDLWSSLRRYLKTVTDAISYGKPTIQEVFLGVYFCKFL